MKKLALLFALALSLLLFVRWPIGGNSHCRVLGDGGILHCYGQIEVYGGGSTISDYWWLK